MKNLILITILVLGALTSKAQSPVTPPMDATRYGTKISMDSTKTLITKVFFNPGPARALSTPFQISATRDARISFGVQISVTLTLQASVTLQLSPNGTSGWVNVGTASIGVSLGLIQTPQFDIVVPAGYYVQIVATGTGATFTYKPGQEVLL